MKIVTKAVLAALALTGSAMAVSAPANAQVSAYLGVGSGDPGYGGYYESDPYADPYYADPYDNSYADPYACDYYEPPWGYPPDYCSYQTWNQPVYFGGLWYGGPIYYRSYGAERLFWLNGGWRRDEWRGSRPGRIDWGRNMRWNGPIQHRGGFAGGGNWNGGSNFAGRNWNGGGSFQGGGRFGGNGFGGGNRGQNFVAPNNVPNNNGGGGFRGRVGGGNNGQNFVAPQNGGGQGGGFQGGGVRGRFGGANVAPQNSGQGAGTQGGGFRGRFGSANVAPQNGGGGPGFVQPNNAPNNGGVRGRFGGQAFQGTGPRAGGQGGGSFQGGGNRGDRGGARGQNRRGG